MKKTKYPPTGIYEHYKTTPDARKLYQLLSFALHTETEEILAIYIPLYFVDDHPHPRIYARPLDMFLENVEYKGKTMPRFNYLGPEL